MEKLIKTKINVNCNIFTADYFCFNLFIHDLHLQMYNEYDSVEPIQEFPVLHFVIIVIIDSNIQGVMLNMMTNWYGNINYGINVMLQGRSQDLGGGGGQEFFFSDFGICMSRSDMLRMAKPCALLGGFGGMLPRENFLKRCNLVRFRVYFDQILSLFFSKKCHFLYKN